MFARMWHVQISYMRTQCDNFRLLCGSAQFFTGSDALWLSRTWTFRL